MLSATCNKLRHADRIRNIHYVLDIDNACSIDYLAQNTMT